MNPLNILIVLAAAPLLAQNKPARTQPEIGFHHTILGARAPERPVPIPIRYVYDEKRDWVKQPLRLAVVLIECSDKKHEAIHSASFYDELLFPRDKYHKQPDGKESFGSVADWSRVQSRGRVEMMGKVFDWVSNDQTFEAVHTMSSASSKHPQGIPC